MSAKYEYMLETWGGFYNDEHKAKHGLEPGYFWFDTATERESFKRQLQAKADELNAHMLATNEEEGTETRLRTIAKLTVYRAL